MSAIPKAYFILYVREQQASRDFFAGVLGCLPTLDVPGMTEFTLGEGVVLGLMPERGIARLLNLEEDAMPPDTVRGEIYLMVTEPDAYHRRALAAGARELSPLAARDWGDRVAYSLEPNGYVLAFAGPGGGL